ncbi:MAG TPA: thioredoxin domain-containing protein [Anaeromyxobacteraceae bacterium]|nr:thioredoxin domain-containing protein [Anaeromyxobacteraceae bacterium]
MRGTRAAAACSLLALAGCGGDSAGFESTITSLAQQVGLDVTTWQACRGSASPLARIGNDVALGEQFGVAGTPTTFVNGAAVVGAAPLSDFQTAVGDALAAATQSGVPASQYYAQLASATNSTAPPVTSDAWVRGPSDAWVTLVEFADYECPFCAAAEPTLEQLLQLYPGEVRLVFKNFPLSIHPHAPAAAIAAECAGEQGKFWEMHDAIFANRSALFAGDD